MITANNSNLIVRPDRDIRAENHLDLHTRVQNQSHKPHKNIGCGSGGRRIEFNRVASPRGTRPGTATPGTSRPSPQ
jgi:hypothetical protein